ncbi:MAG: tetratricopeptide repeat protein [Gammaproteobacteria bacterium]|nr:tetratricopeptide repeat protein [Gammaproteobacteria bacterium]
MFLQRSRRERLPDKIIAKRSNIADKYRFSIKFRDYRIAIVVALTISLVVSGCVDNQQSLNEKPLQQHTELQTSWLDNTSCQIALSPIHGVAEDSRIAQYQQDVTQSRQPLIHLEKLGWALVAKARESFDPGYYTLALETAKCLAQSQPDQIDALVIQAHVLNNLHRFKEAEVIATQAVTQRGQWFEYAILGDAQMEQGRLNDAEQSYQHMIDQRPGPQAYSRAAHMRWLFGDVDGAIDLMLLAVQANSSSQSEYQAWANVRLASYLFQQADFNSANKLLQQVLQQHPNYAPALLLRGRMFLAEDNFTRAISVFQAAAQLNPLPEYYWLLAEAFAQSGMQQQAESILQSLHTVAAVEDQRTYSLFLSTTNTDTNQALTLAEQEMQIRQDVFSKDALAWALYKTNRFTQALKVLDDVMLADTEDARLFYHAALIYQSNAQYQKASSAYHDALALQHMLYPSERHDLLSRSAMLMTGHNTS